MIRKLYHVTCDVCGERTDGAPVEARTPIHMFVSTAEAQEHAAALGWRHYPEVTPGVDVCPSCLPGFEKARILYTKEGLL